MMRGTAAAEVPRMSKPSLLLFLSSTLLFAFSSSAQDARNAVYFELGGSAVIPSFNYERRLNQNWFGRAGLSIVTSDSADDSETDTTLVIPLTGSYVTRPASNHHLEVGGGLTIAAGDEQDLYDFGDDEDDQFSTALVTGLVGYRYQKPAGGFQFRAVFTPIIGGGEFAPWAGLSFGYAW